MELLNTLYVTSEHSYLRVENDTLRLDIDGEKRGNFPPHHFSAIVCLGDVMMTPAVVRLCAERGISLVYLDRNGRFCARMEGAVAGNILLRKAQYKSHSDSDFSLGVAKLFVAAKLRNSRNILLRGARDAKEDVAAEKLRAAALPIKASMRRLLEVKTMDELRGVEGEAARVYFSAFSYLLAERYRDDFMMSGRNRRPPRDRINALLSFLYALLMNDCRSAVEAAGLDPQMGFLHTVRPGRAALALDIMEEMRAFIADRLALSLINRGQISAGDFTERDGGAVEMAKDARKTVIIAYQERKKDEITYPLLKTPVRLGLLWFLQARVLSRVIRGDIPQYVPFLVR